MEFGLSRIHGELDGEKKDTLDYQLKVTPVVSKMNPMLLILNELSYIYKSTITSNYIYYLSLKQMYILINLVFPLYI